MSQTTLITVVRHGESEWNAQRRVQGHADPDLTSLGRRQADQVAVRLGENAAFDVLYSSDLSRARQTAQPIAEATGLTIVEEPQLREWNLGDFEGLSISEAATRFGRVFDMFQGFHPEATIPRGESYRTFYQRSTKAVESLALRHPGGRVLAIAHGGLINCLLRKALAIPMSETMKYDVQNTSLHHFALDIHSDETLRWKLLETESDRII